MLASMEVVWTAECFIFRIDATYTQINGFLIFIYLFICKTKSEISQIGLKLAEACCVAKNEVTLNSASSPVSTS